MNRELDINAIPVCLRQRCQWVCWKLELRKGKSTKVPYDAKTGRMASTTDPTTWASFEDAIVAWRKNEGYAGIGYVFAADDPYCGVDLDDCIDERGQIKPWGQREISALDSYSEVSPSGGGVKVIAQASKPGELCKKAYEDGLVEMYDHSRFFTVTGRRLENVSANVEERQPQIDALYVKVFGRPKPTASLPAATGELHLPQAPGQARGVAALPQDKLDALLANDGRFRATWERRRADLADQSASSYDLALANAAVAAEWADDEIAALIREWRRKHGEDQQKAKRADYIQRTIAKARQHPQSPQPADPGLTKRLSDAILKTEHFARDAGGRLYVFAGGVYRPSGEMVIKRAVKRLLNEWNQPASWTSRRAAEVVEYIRVDAAELLECPPLDTINLLNGLLDVKTRQLRPHDPAFLSPIQLPVAFDPAATCPRWVKFASEVLPADSQAIVWQVAAWEMLPITSLQKALLALGEGSNGKSTLLTALTAFIGKRNIAAVSLHKLESDRFAVARLVGKLANICPDLPSAHLAGTSTFKALTGGDVLLAERKYMDSFEFTPFARLLFSANHPPRSSDSSHAFFRRWVVVPFTRTFTPDQAIPRDVLDAQLASPNELSGVLNKALDALPGLLTNGFIESESMRQAWNEFRENTDPVAVWLEENTVWAPELLVPKRDLLGEYNKSARREQRPPMTPMAFGQAIKRLHPDIQEAQRTVGGAVTWVWLGVGLKSTEPDPAG